jgi:lipopolysaccharide biosynthesis glycosyltransferase
MAVNNGVSNSNPSFLNYLKVALHTAKEVGYDDILLLYDGKEPDVKCNKIKCRSRFYDLMVKTLRPDQLPMALGTMLRLEIPYLLTDEYVLYTDVDVIFKKKMTDEEMPRPEYWAMTFEHCPTDPVFNAGVTVMHLPKLKDPAFDAFIEKNFYEAAQISFDQKLINDYYRGKIEELHPKYNWRPYWPDANGIAILHLHGPKPMESQEKVNSFPEVLRPMNFYVWTKEWFNILCRC